MSDDLIKRLEQYSKPGRGDDHPQAVACREAKDRIEQLERELEAMQDRLDTANKARANAMSMAAAKQAKLAKAVGALWDIYDITVYPAEIDLFVRRWIEVHTRAILDELEGKE
jgi:exonuclease VII small subunit